jgi:Flp pilus assembly pilin Flp
MPSPRAVAEFLRIANRARPKSEEGQDLLEYGLLAALIALVAFSAVATVGETIYNVFWKSIEAAF